MPRFVRVWLPPVEGAGVPGASNCAATRRFKELPRGLAGLSLRPQQVRDLEVAAMG
jgi:hypothetical protein